MTNIRQALAFSFLERYLLLAISLGSNMAIARLLTPEAIGVFSVSMAFVGIAQVLRDFGVASYLIQEPKLTDAHVRTAFSVLLIMGGAVFVALFLAAPLVARTYGEPAMVDTLRICALNFLALPFCTVSLALLRREMKFQQLAVVGFTAAVAGAAVSVGLAAAGYGVISLAIGSVVVNVVTGVGAAYCRGVASLIRPGLGHWRVVLGFGAQSSFTGVITSVSMDINDIAVGKILGFEPVAVLSRAQGLMYLFHRDLMGAVRNVAYPSFARAHREGQALEQSYVTSVTHVCVVAWPFYGFLSLYALDVLRMLFGPQWDAAAPLVPLFCLAGGLGALTSLVTSLLIAAGRNTQVTQVELVLQPLRAVLVVAAVLYFKSLAACALALVAFTAFSIPVWYWLKGRSIPNDWPALRRKLGQSALVSVVSLAVPGLIWLWQADSRGATGTGVMLASALACAICWCLSLVWLKHPLAADPAFVRLMPRWLLPPQTKSPSDFKP